MALRKLQPTDVESDGVFEALVVVNSKWLSHYARIHAAFSVGQAFLERNSLWMNTYFQKNRMITAPDSKQAKLLLAKHHEAVYKRLRSVPAVHSESEFSTSMADPIAALVFAASVDRCPEAQVEQLMTEAIDLMNCKALQTNANRSGFAVCIFRFLLHFAEPQKRILSLRLLVLLAEDDPIAVVNACQIAAQGQAWQPNMFIFSLQRRHRDNPTICELATRLLGFFAGRMPITSPIQLDTSPTGLRSLSHQQQEAFPLIDNEFTLHSSSISSPLPRKKTFMLPTIENTCYGGITPILTPFSPTTTISAFNNGEQSPYAPNVRLPIARPYTSSAEQARRSTIFSTPKLAAVDGERRRRCRTPNASESKYPYRGPSSEYSPDDCIKYASNDTDTSPRRHRTLDPLDGSSPKASESSPVKKRIVLSEKYSWNPECINSVSGFEWWWRSLPQNHANLEPTQKLKMVTKAAVRLHTKGDWQRAIELYLLALSMDVNEEVEFRLRINLACAYEAAQTFQSSVDEIRAALKLKPHDAYAHFKLGDALTAIGAFENARKEYEAVINVYPQAGDSLNRLREAEEQQIREEEAKKAAIANAKIQRTPVQKQERMHNSGHAGRLMAASPPTIPHKPENQSPVVSRKIASSSLRNDSKAQPDSSFTDAASESTQLILLNSRKADFVSVTTSTNEEEAPLGLLDLLIKRCDETQINLPELIRKMDLQLRGRVPRNFVVGLFQILCGVNFNELGSDIMQHALKIAPEDWEHEKEHAYLRYANFIDAYLAKRISQEMNPSDSELRPIHELLENLITTETEFVLQYIAERNVDEWTNGGKQHVAQDLCLSIQQSKQKDILRNDSPSNSDAEGQDSIASRPGTHGNDDNDMNRLHIQEKSDNACVSVCSSTVSITRDELMVKVTSADVKKLKAREHQILLAEKAHIITRKHLHCLKYLRDVASQALKARAERQARCEHLPYDYYDKGSMDATDGYRVPSPRYHTKREQARADAILRTEKARIIARKHAHCVKSLRAIAIRARAHQLARRAVRSYLAKVADHARQYVKAKRYEHALPAGESTPLIVSVADIPQRGALTCIQTLSEETYAAASHVAIQRVQSMVELRQLAQMYAAFCQVPMQLQEVHPADG